MANTHIYPEGNTRLGGELKNLIEQMKNVYADCQNLVGIMAAIGTTEGTWTELAAELGFTGEDAGTHTGDAYNILSGAWFNSINTGDYKDVINRMG